MAEEEFLNRIKDARNAAISNSDTRLANKVIESMNEEFDFEPILLILLLVCCVVILGLAKVIFFPHQNSVTIMNNEFVIDARSEIHKGIVNEYVNITTIERHESVIKGDKRMVCVGQMNESKTTCYRTSDDEILS